MDQYDVSDRFLRDSAHLLMVAKVYGACLMATYEGRRVILTIPREKETEIRKLISDFMLGTWPVGLKLEVIDVNIEDV